MTDTSISIGHKRASKYIIPIISKLLGDQQEVIRRVVIGHIVRISKFFYEKKDKYYEDIFYLLNLTQQYTTDSNPNVRQAAMDALIEIGYLLDEEDVKPRLLPIVKSLAKDRTEEEHRVEGAILLNELAPVMKKDLCINFAIPYIQELAEDENFRVRKAVASHLGKICKTVGVEVTTEKILPLFEKLSNNELWGVRKACLESLVDISENISNEKRIEVLVPIFQRFIKDTRWVEMAAYQYLGKFIFTFYNHEVPDVLLQCFKSMPESNDHNTHCAHYFPAVLYTTGKEKWVDELYEPYTKLMKSENIKVRKSLSASLHEIASILGTELTETYLMEAFDLFLKDLSEVKFGVVASIAKFFSVLSPDTRKEKIQDLLEIQREKKWRFRKLLAKQIDSLFTLYSPSDILEYIMPLFIALRKDDVASVRKTVIKGIPSIIKSIQSNQELLETFLKELNTMPSDPSYQTRQLYANICLQVLGNIDNELFEKEFLSNVISLSNDKVPNVRIIIYKCLNNLLKIDLKDKEKIQNILDNMEIDVDM